MKTAANFIGLACRVCHVEHVRLCALFNLFSNRHLFFFLSVRFCDNSVKFLTLHNTPSRVPWIKESNRKLCRKSVQILSNVVKGCFIVTGRIVGVTLSMQAVKWQLPSLQIYAVILSRLGNLWAHFLSLFVLHVPHHPAPHHPVIRYF